MLSWTKTQASVINFWAWLSALGCDFVWLAGQTACPLSGGQRLSVSRRLLIYTTHMEITVCATACARCTKVSECMSIIRGFTVCTNIITEAVCVRHANLCPRIVAASNHTLK